jgi:hypothetical protein
MENLKYSWRIENFLKKNTENLENVIYSITWTRTAVDPTNNTPTSICSTIPLEVPVNAEGFIPYEQLTEQNIIAWLDENIDLEKLNKRLWDQIEHNRSLVQPPNFPWN